MAQTREDAHRQQQVGRHVGSCRARSGLEPGSEERPMSDRFLDVDYCCLWATPRGEEPLECWCRQCTRRKVLVPPVHPWRHEEPRTCCTDAWIARAWFCRWCGRDWLTGRHSTAYGIYGGRDNNWQDPPSHCACGWELWAWTNFNYSCCGSCYWVTTIQLVQHLHAKFECWWSKIHERFFDFLIEPAVFSYPWGD